MAWRFASRIGFLSLAFALLAGALSLGAFDALRARASGAEAKALPTPRFVSLKSSRVNMRAGPGKHYPVRWIYLKAGLPMEIMQELGNWRKVRCPYGEEGWIFHSLLSGKRTVIFAPWLDSGEDNPVALTSRPDSDSEVKARVQPEAIGSVEFCEARFCRLRVEGIAGYAEKELLWGVYPDEILG